MFRHSHLLAPLWLVACLLYEKEPKVDFSLPLAPLNGVVLFTCCPRTGLGFSVDEYMLAGWLAPLLGIVLQFIWYYLRKH